MAFIFILRVVYLIGKQQKYFILRRVYLIDRPQKYSYEATSSQSPVSGDFAKKETSQIVSFEIARSRKRKLCAEGKTLPFTNSIKPTITIYHLTNFLKRFCSLMKKMKRIIFLLFISSIYRKNLHFHIWMLF